MLRKKALCFIKALNQSFSFLYQLVADFHDIIAIKSTEFFS